MGQVTTKEERAYAAGLFDGEGCVQLYMREKGGRALRTVLSVSSTVDLPLLWLYERYDGHFSCDNRVTAAQRKVFHWSVMTKQAERFAQEIRPYVLVKKDQLDLWIYARSLVLERGSYGKCQPRLTDEQVAERHSLVDLCKELKRVG